jgi:hypothetical protein
VYARPFLSEALKAEENQVYHYSYGEYGDYPVVFIGNGNQKIIY